MSFRNKRLGAIVALSAVCCACAALLGLIATRVEAASGCAAPTFGNPLIYPMRGFPPGIGIGDFNKDGKSDLAIASQNTAADTVAIYMGNGAGGFSGPVEYGIGEAPWSIVVGDFNEDGNSDLAVSSVIGQSVSIMLGAGNGSFSVPIIYRTGLSPRGIVIGDFNEDGNSDLAVAVEDAHSLSIMLGAGNGSFGAPTSFPVGKQPIVVAMGDFNEDGHADLVTTNIDGVNISILLGTGTGGFGATTNLPTVSRPGGVAVGDFNEDGHSDLIVSNVFANSISIFPGTGTGSFGAVNTIPARESPGTIVVNDFNGDGKKDIVISNGTGSGDYNFVTRMFGLGTGGFGPPANFTTHPPRSAPYSLAVGDFNGDGKPDLVTGNIDQLGNSFSILINTSCGPDISVNDATVTEGDNPPSAATASFNITLSTTSTWPVTVGYSTTAGTASQGSDFGALGGTITFAPGETSRTVVVPVSGDSIDEFDETFALKLSNPVGGTIDRGEATGTILDDDAAPTISIDTTGQFAEGNTGTSVFSFIVSLSKESGKPITVGYTTADNTAKAGSDYQAASGFVTFLPGQPTFQLISVMVTGDTINEPDETFLVNLSNPVNATIQQAQSMTTIFNDDIPTIQLSQSGYTVPESAGFINIIVTRSGDTSAPASVKYATSDFTDANFRCDPNTAGQATIYASRKCDYHIAVGTLRFAAGETTKQFTLSLTDDVYVETSEAFTLTLSNPAGGILGTNGAATVIINDNDTYGQANPIDNTGFFVRQLYVDLLSREPDPNGWNGWTTRIDQCGQPGQPPPPCDRVTVAGDGFLRSGEFFDRQFFVIRLYRTGLGRILRYEDVGDLAYVSGFLTPEQLELNKQDLVAEVVSRAEFTSRHNSLNNGQFVDTLLQTAGVATQIQADVRQGWVAALDSNTKSRAQVFREISERVEVSNRYAHEAQVVSAYYGFFTRNPDGAYLNYLQRLDSGEINLADLANAFVNAQEYRQRFGP